MNRFSYILCDFLSLNACNPIAYFVASHVKGLSQ